MKVYYYIILSVLLLEWSVADVLSHDVQYCSSDVDLIYRYCAETPLPNPTQQGTVGSTQETVLNELKKKDSIAQRVRDSIIPRLRDSISQRLRDSISQRVRDTIIPRLRDSISQRIRDSIAKRANVRTLQATKEEATTNSKQDPNNGGRQNQGEDGYNGNLNGTIQENTPKPNSNSEQNNSGGEAQDENETKGSMEDVVYILIVVGILLSAGIGYTIGRIRGVRVQRRRMQKMSQKTVSNKCGETTEKQGRKGMGECEETQTEDCGNAIHEEICESVEPQSVKEATNSLPTEWTVLYGSQIGRSHIMNEMPCQDCCATEDLGSGWGICVVSDGAGSAANSKDASRYICRSIPVIFKGFLTQGQFIEQGCLPSDEVWRMAARQGFIRLKRELAILAFGNELDLKSLAATCMVAIYSPYGILCTHIGDGRGGYHDVNKDEWIPLFQPHKGEEANQTLFLTSLWENLGSINNVPVPESSVYRTAIDAVCLLSDGMEHATFFCRTYDETTKKYYDPNCPSPEVFNKLSASVRAMLRSGISYEEMQYNWLRYLEAGNSQIQNEPDDRTLLLAVKHLDHESV